MSDTARTDNAEKNCVFDRELVAFARTLERELAALTAERDAAMQDLQRAVVERHQFKTERDAALAELGELRAYREARDMEKRLADEGIGGHVLSTPEIEQHREKHKP